MHKPNRVGILINCSAFLPISIVSMSNKGWRHSCSVPVKFWCVLIWILIILKIYVVQDQNFEASNLLTIIQFWISGSNKKERRRTQSINNAFSSLRDCIPNVPCDTKLSKIKTLRLATSYIDYLMQMLNSENVTSNAITGFKADIHKRWKEKSEEQKRRELVRTIFEFLDSLLFHNTIRTLKIGLIHKQALYKRCT